MTAAKPGAIRLVQKHQPLSQGLVASWLLSEGGGLTFRDASGRDKHLTASATAPTWIGTPSGWGLNFGGSATSTLSERLIASGPFSVSVLVAPASISVSQWIWSQGTLAGGSFMGVGINSTGVPRWEISGSSIIGTLALTLNAWVLLTLTYDGTRAINKMVSYKDAVQDQVSATTANYTADTMRLGSSSNTAPGAIYSGKMAGAMVWNRALSQGEVAALVDDFFLPARKRKSVLKSAAVGGGIVQARAALTGLPDGKCYPGFLIAN